MDEFLRRAPKSILAVGILVAGFFLIIMANPPRTVCDEQLDLFRQSQKTFLYSASDKVKKSAADEMFEYCKKENVPGGCFDLFLNLRNMVDALERMPKTCAKTIGQDDFIKSWMFKSVRLLILIAWGDEGPGIFLTKKLGWLDTADFRLYCRMKTLTIRFYGQEEFDSFRESVMNNLPGGEKQSREQRWQRTIFSSSCEQ